ncbi:MAG: DNA polymerase IV [candidate division Zixibacteria bacterium]
MGKDRIIALVDMNAFLASVEQALNPDLIGKPVIVGGEPGTRGIVICASYEARKLGVGFGVPLAEAYRRLPRATFVKGDIKIYLDYWRQAQGIFEEYSPLVEPVSMDEAYLDLTGCRNRFKSVRELGISLKNEIFARLNIRCSMGISVSKMFAKIACNMRKPDGLTVIGREKALAMLPSLPVRQIVNIGYKSERLLTELGVMTAGDLQTVPLPVLTDLFGVRGKEWHEYALGIDNRKVKQISGPKTISRETTFNADSVDREFLNGTLYYLLERVCQKLRELDMVAGRIGAKLRYIDYASTDGFKTLRFPSNVEGEIHGHVKTLFDQLYTRKVGVRHLGVTAVKLSPAFRQIRLFDSERPFDLARGLDKIRANLGYHAVFTGRTMPLGKNFREVVDGYELRTPSLSK